MLRDSAKIRFGYEPQIISMANKASIEDFIQLVYDLGYSNIPIDGIRGLLHKTINEKLILCKELVLEVKKQKELIYVLDNYSMIMEDGSLADWFWKLLELLGNDDKLYVCIISRVKFRHITTRFSDKVFSLNLPELNPTERQNLFTALLDIFSIELTEEEVKNILSLFNGFPDQIFFAIDVIKTEGYNYLFKNSAILSEFNYDKVHALISRFQSPFTDNLLAILSYFDFVSFSFLETVLKHDFDKAIPLIDKFLINCIAEYVGSDKEYIRLNDVVRDYITRSTKRMSPIYLERIKANSKNLLANYETASEDISSWFIALKEALKNGDYIDDSILIPSHFLGAMKDLYNTEKKYNQVAALAERVLANEKFLDARILQEVRYYYCQALARMRDPKMLQEVQKINGLDHGYLLGFYYRLTGRYEDAIVRLQQVISEYGDSFKAMRELVLSYLNLEQFSHAINYARQVYNRDKSNAYNLQSYFRCLIKMFGSEAKAELMTLLERFDRIKNEKTEEMYLSSKAQFNAIVQHDYYSALNTLNDAISKSPTNFYPYLTKLEVSRRFKKMEDLANAISEIENSFPQDSEVYRNIGYLAAKTVLLKFEGRTSEAISFMNNQIRYKFPEQVYKALSEEISH